MTHAALTGFLSFTVLALGSGALCHWLIRNRWFATVLAVAATLEILFLLVGGQLRPFTWATFGAVFVVVLFTFVPVYLVGLLFSRKRSAPVAPASDSQPASQLGALVLRLALGGFYILSSAVAYGESRWLALACHLLAFTLLFLPKETSSGLSLSRKMVLSVLLWIAGILLQALVLDGSDMTDTR